MNSIQSISSPGIIVDLSLFYSYLGIKELYSQEEYLNPWPLRKMEKILPFSMHGKLVPHFLTPGALQLVRYLHFLQKNEGYSIGFAVKPKASNDPSIKEKQQIIECLLKKALGEEEYNKVTPNFSIIAKDNNYKHCNDFIKIQRYNSDKPPAFSNPEFSNTLFHKLNISGSYFLWSFWNKSYQKGYGKEGDLDHWNRVNENTGLQFRKCFLYEHYETGYLANVTKKSHISITKSQDGRYLVHFLNKESYSLESRKIEDASLLEKLEAIVQTKKIQELKNFGQSEEKKSNYLTKINDKEVTQSICQLVEKLGGISEKIFRLPNRLFLLTYLLSEVVESVKRERTSMNALKKPLSEYLWDLQSKKGVINVETLAELGRRDASYLKGLEILKSFFQGDDVELKLVHLLDFPNERLHNPTTAEEIAEGSNYTNTCNIM